MAQSIKYTNKKRGVSLMELILYMGIFVMLVIGVLYSALYMQKVLEYNAVEYKAQEQTYRQLGLLQQHMNSAGKIEVGSSSLKIFSRYGYMEQFLQDKTLHMRYVYPQKPILEIIPYPYLRLEKFSFVLETGHETLLGNSMLKVEMERLDSRGKPKTLQERIIAPTLPKNP